MEDNIRMRTLLRISLPLMISYLSMFTMMFVDRAFLAQLSPEALNAGVRAGTLAWAVNLGWITLAAMAEVFVAQYNGAKAYGKLGVPIWQMLWMALFSYLFFAPLSVWGGGLIYGTGSLASEYFRWIVFAGPSYVILSAVSAFFIGQGKTMLITVLAVFGNAVNIILDPILIFGIQGKFPAMGVKGAAIATGIGVIFQAAVLLYVFLKRKNREEKGAGLWHFSPKDFIACLKVGISPAIFVTLEIGGWAVFYHMMSLISEQHIYVAGICQSIFLLFVFFGYGLEKGAAAVAGNLIGAARISEVYRLLRIGLKLIFAFGLITGVLMIAFPDLLVTWFITNSTAESSMELAQAHSLIRIGLILIFVYMIMEKIRWLVSGILTAAGDTFFLMIAGSASVWLAMVLPTYVFIVRPSLSITYAFLIWVIYSTISMGLFFYRFLQGKWKSMQIISETEEPIP